ncbi:MAG: DUF2244 domain-containing protein [Pseudomonadota bacterium]
MKAEWLLKRNCSLSPRQAARIYGLLCGVLLAVGVAFTIRGAWLVLPFAMINIGGVIVALLYYARHASDHEHIALSEDCLLVERIDAGQLQQVRLDPYWTRIAVPNRKRPLIELESRGIKVAIGRYISEEAREDVAQELRNALRTRSFLS